MFFESMHLTDLWLERSFAAVAVALVYLCFAMELEPLWPYCRTTDCSSLAHSEGPWYQQACRIRWLHISKDRSWISLWVICISRTRYM